MKTLNCKICDRIVIKFSQDIKVRVGTIIYCERCGELHSNNVGEKEWGGAYRETFKHPPKT